MAPTGGPDTVSPLTSNKPHSNTGGQPVERQFNCGIFGSGVFLYPLPCLQGIGGVAAVPRTNLTCQSISVVYPCKQLPGAATNQTVKTVCTHYVVHMSQHKASFLIKDAGSIVRLLVLSRTLAPATLPYLHNWQGTTLILKPWKRTFRPASCVL